MKKNIGYSLIYPEGCKEVNETLKLDELKRRLNDIIKSLEQMSTDRSLTTESLLNLSETTINIDTSNLQLEGLLMHLTSEMFIDHEDADVQLRVAVCICLILQLYCPNNPFLAFTDSKHRLNIVLTFLLKSINEMAKLKSKSDKYFLNLYKIFSMCCQTNLFHWFTICDDGETIFMDCFRTFFNIIKRFSDWSNDDSRSSKMVSDALVSLITYSTGSIEGHSIPDRLVSFIINFLADRCATRDQKALSVDIISRCVNKLDDQIQSILQNYLIKNEIDDDLSDSEVDDADVEEADNDDFCSISEFKMTKTRKVDQKPEKKKVDKLDRKKNSIETSVEYCCDHTFQLVYELFKINQSIALPLLPTVEMKLKSANNVTDRKRACRLLGKLFSSYTHSIFSDSNNHSSLWECFLGRFCDIDVSVREICVRFARDVLKRAATGSDFGGILSLPSAKEDLVKALQKRSHDQEESIRYQLVLSISQIFESSRSIVVDEELDFVNDTLLKILFDRTRDKCTIVRKEANASLSKLYRRIISESDNHSESINRHVDVTLGLKNLSTAQRNRLELLLTQILRLYLRQEVEDKIVVERLFNTFLVPYNLDSLSRMKALLQCFIICDDATLMSVQELFKTQVMIMNSLRDTVYLIRDSHSEKVLSPSVSQKLKEKIKRMSEYLPNKDKVESLNKFFVLMRSDKKLYDILLKLVNPESSRDVIVKSISEVRRHFSITKPPGTDPNPASVLKKKAFLSTIKCLLERSAPVIMDLVSGQELISLLVSSKEALESSKDTQDYILSISRSLKLIHVISIIYRNSIPTQETYEYIASIISQFDFSQLEVPSQLPESENAEERLSTPSSTNSLKSLISSVATCNSSPMTIEELCLLILGKIIGPRSLGDSCVEADDEHAKIINQEQSKTVGLFSDDTEAMTTITVKVTQYLINCAMNGSAYPFSLPNPRSPGKSKNKDRRNFPPSSDDGDRENCAWKYNARIAKLATKCLIGLYASCQQEARAESSTSQSKEILSILESKLDDLVKNSSNCDLFSAKQTISLSTLTQLGLNLRRRYGVDIHQYVENVVLLGILTTENESAAPSEHSTLPRNLSSWTNNASISVVTQVKLQALKMLSKWMVILKVDEDRNLILSVMVCLRKYIGSYSNVQYEGNITDGDMSQIRLAAGKCWLRLAQVQSFLSIFDVKWLHRLSSLIYDPCSHVREGFLRKLHKGLFTLQLPLDYMAMFAFVPLVPVPEYLAMAKNYFSANVTRRREFLERNPQYLTDAKLLFAVLPEYVLAFIIHMLAHDDHWSNIDDQTCICRVKQCLWFVMEPILKLNENSSFIRKLLEKIKHAQDATDPTNLDLNEKLYICCDISLGLLISKQAPYDLKEYPVELKLPRTRYLPAPNTFFNPDFANILLKDPPRVRIQFSPTHKSKQMIMNFMPAPLIKGHVQSSENNNNNTATSNFSQITEDVDSQTSKPSVTVVQPVKPKKHVAKIVVGLPEIESESVPNQSHPVEQVSFNQKKLLVRKSPTKRKIGARNQSPVSEVEEFESNSTSVTKRGRVCKPNVRVMKDMVSLSKKANVTISSPVTEKESVQSDLNFRFDATVSINLERIQPPESHEDSDVEEVKNVSPIPVQNIESPKKKFFKRKINVRKVVSKITKPIVSPKIRKSREVTSPVSSKSPKTPKSISRLTRATAETTPKVSPPPKKKKKIDEVNLKISIQDAKKIDEINRKISTKVSKKIDEVIPKTPTKTTISSSTRSTTRSSRGLSSVSSNSTILNKLTKQILTRKASSIRVAKRKEKDKETTQIQSKTIVLEAESSAKVTNNRKRKHSISPTRHNTNEKQIKSPRKSNGTVKMSPLDIVSRSKRFASRAATDTLVKFTSNRSK